MERYTSNHYRSRRYGDKFLITTDHGTWVIVSSKDFGLLNDGKVDKGSELFGTLENEGVIITEKNQRNIIESMRKKYEFLFQGPSLHIVVPTLRCNMDCVYCHASSKHEDSTGYDMDKATAKNVIDFIFQSPSSCINIEFQGGEPLLRFDIVKYMIEYANKVNETRGKSLMFSLVSNMTLMDDDKMRFLLDNMVGVCGSLDGHEMLHNKNRPYSGGNSYKFTREWLKKIHNEWRKRPKRRNTNALVTVTKYSLPRWKEIVDEYMGLGIYDIFFKFLNNLGTAKTSWRSIGYSADDFISFWKNAVDYIIELNKHGKDIREWFTWIMLRKIISNEEPNYLEQRSPCGAAIGQIAYDYNGDIYSCDEARMIGEDIFKLGNVNKNDSFSKVLTSNKVCSIVSASVNDTQICDACAFKPYCGLCPVCNYSEQGTTIAKVPETSRCKIYMAQFDYVFDKLINDKEAREVFARWLEKG